MDSRRRSRKSKRACLNLWLAKFLAILAVANWKGAAMDEVEIAIASLGLREFLSQAGVSSEDYVAYKKGSAGGIVAGLIVSKAKSVVKRIKAEKDAAKAAEAEVKKAEAQKAEAEKARTTDEAEEARKKQIEELPKP